MSIKHEHERKTKTDDIKCKTIWSFDLFSTNLDQLKIFDN